MAAVIRGVVGLVKWSYYTAAAINGYTVTRTEPDKRWVLVATVVQHDAFKMNQRPLRFEAPHQGGAWVWPIEDFTLDNGRLAARLGAPQDGR